MTDVKRDVVKVKEIHKYIVLIVLAIITFIIGVVLEPNFSNLMDGLLKIIKHHSLANSDYLAIGTNYGSTFINSAIIQLCVIATYAITKTEIKGNQMAAFGITLGYTFYSKSVYNVWPLVFGVFLEAKMHGRKASDVSATAWYSTAISSIVSVFAFGTPSLEPGGPLAITLGIIFGLVGGYLVGMIAVYAPTLHHRYILYNLGFSTGIVGMFLFSIMQVTGLGHGPYKNGIYVQGENKLIAIILLINFAYLFICGVVLNGGFKNAKDLIFGLRKSFDGVTEFGFGVTLMNMAIMGCVGMAYLLCVPFGHLGGPTMAGIWTVAAFAAVGKSIRASVPVMLGIAFGQWSSGTIKAYVTAEGPITFAEAATAGGRWMSQVNQMIATQFGQGLSPVTANFGTAIGFVAGIFHSFTVPFTGALHGWMCTYNNGFAQGIVMTFYRPFSQYLSRLTGHEQPEDLL